MMPSIHVEWQQAANELDVKGRNLKLAMTGALKESGKKVKEDFLRPTRTWQHRVGVEVLTNITSTGVELLAGTDDKIYTYLEYGTRPHTIRPKRAKALRFMSGFRPKTTPGSLWSGAGGSFGDRVYAGAVRHPGTKPRRWLPIIQRRAQKFTLYSIRKHLEQWAK